MGATRKLQRTLYRTAKQQPERRFTYLYDKIYRKDVLEEAWRRVRQNGGAAGVDRMDMEEVTRYGEERFLTEIQEELITGSYRSRHVRRVHIPKAGQPGKTRPLGIPTVKDRVVQMATKIVIEPLFEADFKPCSYGFRPERTPRMALNAIMASFREGYHHVVDVDLKSYFDTIDHDLLMKLVERRVTDIRVLRLIRGWLKAGVVVEGKVENPVRGTPQGGVISPLLSNIFLHEVDRQWSGDHPAMVGVRLVRYADDMVLLARTEREAQQAWELLKEQFAALLLTVNEEKSKLTTTQEGFCFLGFEFRKRWRKVYMWPRQKAVTHIMERVSEAVRTTPLTTSLTETIRKLNAILNGWCTYFRVGNSNRIFHKVDWMVREKLQIWMRRKHHIAWGKAKVTWNYHVLHEQFRLYRMVGKVSHLEAMSAC